MLRSIRSAPASATVAAAERITSGSWPKSWIAIGPAGSRSSRVDAQQLGASSARCGSGSRSSRPSRETASPAPWRLRLQAHEPVADARQRREHDAVGDRARPPSVQRSVSERTAAQRTAPVLVHLRLRRRARRLRAALATRSLSERADRARAADVGRADDRRVHGPRRRAHAARDRPSCSARRARRTDFVERLRRAPRRRVPRATLARSTASSTALDADRRRRLRRLQRRPRQDAPDARRSPACSSASRAASSRRRRRARQAGAGPVPARARRAMGVAPGDCVVVEDARRRRRGRRRRRHAAARLRRADGAER